MIPRPPFPTGLLTRQIAPRYVSRLIRGLMLDAGLAIGLFLAGNTSAFTNSIYGYADPFLTYTNGLYYLLGTGNDTIKVVSAPALAGLHSGKVAGVYHAGVFFESPELYWMGPPDNHWYIYYTQYPNSVRVIESDTTDPQGTYHYKATLTTNTYDATVIRINGSLYLLGSTYANLVIQPLATPYTSSGPQTAIAGLTQPWETNVIEAPDAVINPAGVLYLLYASGTYNNENYAAGALKFNGGDPLVAANWTKLPGPLFHGPARDGNFATATCSAFKTAGGQDWFVYGGYPTAGFTSRSTRVQPMSWNRDGTPHLGTPLPLGQAINEPAR
jgi:GH43 family beta-xylosidase